MDGFKVAFLISLIFAAIGLVFVFFLKNEKEGEQ